MIRALLLAGCAGLASAMMAPMGGPMAMAPSLTSNGPFKIPPLPYDYSALEPYIDTETMHLHHDKHFNGYAEMLNKALATPEGQPFVSLSLEKMLYNVNTSLPLSSKFTTAVRNQGGGVANHLLFFNLMTPNATGMPTGELASMIDSTFGNFTNFKMMFTEQATMRFGSGFAWLVYYEGKLKVGSTANQDSPLMTGLMNKPGGLVGFPILAIDVWEHSYYLKYKNVRADYVKNWWKVVNWPQAEMNYQQAKLGSSQLEAVY